MSFYGTWGLCVVRVCFVLDDDFCVVKVTIFAHVMIIRQMGNSSLLHSLS